LQESEKDKNCAKDKKNADLGDRLRMTIYGAASQICFGKETDMIFLVSILSFQRQFVGCVDIAKNQSFGKRMLGKKVEPASKDTSDEGTDCRLELASKIVLPPLNESQGRAAESFLTSDHGQISIVQG